MPKWEEIDKIKHLVDRIKHYHCENILRDKVLLDSLKELETEMENLILNEED